MSDIPESKIAQEWRKGEGAMDPPSEGLPRSLDFLQMQHRQRDSRFDWLGTGILAAACAGLLFLGASLLEDRRGEFHSVVQQLVEKPMESSERSGEDFYTRFQMEWGVQRGLPDSLDGTGEPES
jgi:hypothetical protein